MLGIDLQELLNLSLEFDANRDCSSPVKKSSINITHHHQYQNSICLVLVVVFGVSVSIDGVSVGFQFLFFFVFVICVGTPDFILSVWEHTLVKNCDVRHQD
jgi:hypothetical protein